MLNRAEGDSCDFSKFTIRDSPILHKQRGMNRRRALLERPKQVPLASRRVNWSHNSDAIEGSKGLGSGDPELMTDRSLRIGSGDQESVEVRFAQQR